MFLSLMLLLLFPKFTPFLTIVYISKKIYVMLTTPDISILLLSNDSNIKSSMLINIELIRFEFHLINLSTGCCMLTSDL